MRGRNILEGVVTLHETVHELHRKNQSAIIFKIDFDKAYDKVKWDFLLQTLRMKGFSPKWIEWIRSFISGGSVAINVNDEIGPFFQTKKKPSTRRSPFTHSFQCGSQYAIFVHKQGKGR